MKRFLLILTGLLLSISGLHAQNPADLDLSFNADAVIYGEGPNSTVYASAIQPDGKILIGGLFTSYNGTDISRIARLNADGSLDTSFKFTGANSAVLTIAIQPDGKILIGGFFTNGLTRLNEDGSLDTTFNPGTGANSTVWTIALLPDGRILIGGAFTSYNGTSINGIARLNANGSLDNSFDPGTGVDFGVIDPNTNEYYGIVLTITPQADGKILIGGNFSTYNGISRRGIARLNAEGSLDTSFNPGTGASGFVWSTAFQPDGKILIGGFFHSYSGTLRNNVARLNTDGSLDASFNPGTGTDSQVRTLKLQADGKILIGGDFNYYNETYQGGVTRLNADGNLDTSFNPGLGVSGGIISSNTGAFSQVITISLQANGKILIGGEFTLYDSTPIKYVARLNTDGSLTTDNGASSRVRSIALQPDGKVLIGGEFISYNGTSINRIARLHADGSLDSFFDPGTGANNTVNSIALQPDGKILIAGEFTSFNGKSYNRIARLNADGSLDTSFNPGSGANSTVWAIALLPDGKIMVGGAYTSYNGTALNGIARLNANGSLDTTFNPGTGVAYGLMAGADNYANVLSIALQSDGKILIGGDFAQFNGITSKAVARLNVDGSLDASFNPSNEILGWIWKIVLQPGGKILLGGDFTSFSGTFSNHIRRLNADGSMDLTFSYAGLMRQVSALALQPDGKILIGGEFTSYTNTPRNFIARLNENGHLDYSFDPGVGPSGGKLNQMTGASTQIHDFAIQPNGKILIAGEFTEYQGVSRGRIARLYGDWVSDSEKPMPSIEILPDLNFQCDVLYDQVIIPTATDNVDGTVQGTTNRSIFPITLQGPITIIWIYTDEAGNTSSQTQNIIIDDTTAPVPSIAELPVITGQCSATVNHPTALDNCVGTITGTTENPLTYSDQGTYRIIWTFNDGNGNTTTQEQAVIVKDTIAPVPTITNLLVISGQCSATVTAPTAADNCRGTITGTTENPLTYSEQGTYKIIWTYEDGNGNTTIQEQTIIVEDTTVPVPTLTVLPVISGQCSATVTAPTAADNCKGTITGTTENPLTYSEQGTYKILWTYDDGNGNTTNQEQTIIVEDTTAPVPTLTALPVISGQCSATVTAPTAVDNCKGSITGTTENLLTYSAQGAYTILWTFNNGNGNTTTQEQTIIVEDTTAPVPILAQLPVINCQCSATVTAPTAADNCKGSITGTTENPLTYSAQGTYTILWTYNDGNGNTTTQEQTVFVKDTTVPEIQAPENLLITLEAGQVTISEIDLGLAVATDNCSTVKIGNNAPTSFGIGTTSVIWTAEDENGNVSSAVQLVTIIGKVCSVDWEIKEYITLHLNATGEAMLTLSQINLATTSKCGPITLKLDKSIFDCTNIGLNKVLITASDGFGLKESKEIKVNVVDNIRPTLRLLRSSYPWIVLKGKSYTMPDLRFLAIAEDNCGYDLKQFPAPGAKFSKSGNIQVMFIAVDPAGNTSQRSLTIRLRLLKFKSLFNFRMEEIEDGSRIQVPWNTSLSRVQEEFLGLDKEVLQEMEIKQSDYNPLQPGFYAVALANKLELDELGKNIIPFSILVQDKPKALDIELNNQVIAKNVQVGSLIGTLSTIDPDDNIHIYSQENPSLAIKGNRLIWIGTEPPADQMKVTVFSTDRAGQTISKEILLSREIGSNRFHLYPNPAQNLTNVRVDLDHGGEVEIKVFDAVGRLVIEDHLYREETFIQTLDLTGLAQGMYMVQVKIGHIIMTERLIKR
ncbi:T9SS type A sorting domain-containing protein [Rhodonellum sp.]|uniref:T9SS type A sorting domain-containing protein n=1 Tax=Rhodonellum sp. TaxID=2231180 RepID=UPI00271F797D|nr:T9SS type A sorting domain-containing protein [Rhodonellum sp.]MDO9553863.1 T9SS type A sorting domain-containing protein [Rhodonellum sp.]